MTRRSRSNALLLACGALILGAASLAWAQSAQRVTLLFEIEALRLSSGEVTAGSGAAEDAADIVVAFNAHNAVHSVVLPAREGIAIAHLTGAAFDSLDAAAATSVEFPAAAPDRPFVAGTTLLVRTPEGALFKLGNPSEDDAAVSFDCEQL